MKKIILILSIIYSYSLTSFADLVDNGDKQFYGKIIFVNSEKIILKDECNGENREFSWGRNITVKFSEQCNHPGWDMSTSPSTALLECPKRKVFEFWIKSKNDRCYADSFLIKDGQLHIVYSKGKGSIDLPATNLYNIINWLAFRINCEDSIPNDFSTF